MNKHKELLSAVLVITLVSILFLVFVFAKNREITERHWNDGRCAKCYGHMIPDGTAEAEGSTFYKYSCDNCEHYILMEHEVK